MSSLNKTCGHLHPLFVFTSSKKLAQSRLCVRIFPNPVIMHSRDAVPNQAREQLYIFSGLNLPVSTMLNQKEPEFLVVKGTKLVVKGNKLDNEGGVTRCGYLCLLTIKSLRVIRNDVGNHSSAQNRFRTGWTVTLTTVPLFGSRLAKQRLPSSKTWQYYCTVPARPVKFQGATACLRKSCSPLNNLRHKFNTNDVRKLYSYHLKCQPVNTPCKRSYSI